MTVREVSAGDGPAQFLSPPAQLGGHQARTVVTIACRGVGVAATVGVVVAVVVVVAAAAAATVVVAGGVCEGLRAGLRFIGLPIISYLEHSNNTPLTTADSALLNIKSFYLSLSGQPAG